MFSLFKKKDPGFKSIDAVEFKELLKLKDHQALDVRTPQEIAGGKVSGTQAINILDSAFKSKAEKLSKEKAYLVYCRSGSRSRMACKQLKKLGFTRLYNLKGGYSSL